MSPEDESSITVEIGIITDGTPGISITMLDKLIGQLPDSKATSLSLTDSLAVCVCGEHGEQRYLLYVPGTPTKGQQISDTKVVIFVRP
jgi:hypothetical protein